MQITDIDTTLDLLTPNAYERLNSLQEISETDSFTEDRYTQFYKNFPANSKHILDLGCNTGRGGAVLNRHDLKLQIIGLDCVKERLERLPMNVYKKGIYALSTDIPCKSNTFDVVVAGEVLEHLFPEDIDKTLIEIFRVLKIGGRLIITTPNPQDIKRKWKKKKSVLGGCHVSQHFYKALLFRMKMIGYSRTRVYGTGRVSRYLGNRFPLLSLYGSYMAMGDKQ